MRMALVCLIAVLTCAALASAAGNVEKGRSYVGSIGDGGSTGDSGWVGSPIHFTVSADGKAATQIQAVDGIAGPNGCGATDLSRGRLGAFPSTKIVHGTFKTALRWDKTSKTYAIITITGRFLPGGSATGTIRGASNINSSGGQGAPCVVTNPWSAKALPRGSVRCDSFVLSDATAQYITAQHSTCKVVDKAIRKGYKGIGVFRAPPGWTCSHITIPNRGNNSNHGHQCRHKRERFKFVIV